MIQHRHTISMSPELGTAISSAFDGSGLLRLIRMPELVLTGKLFVDAFASVADLLSSIISCDDPGPVMEFVEDPS